jgi:hypothetical protein
VDEWDRRKGARGECEDTKDEEERRKRASERGGDVVGSNLCGTKGRGATAWGPCFSLYGVTRKGGRECNCSTSSMI